MPDRNRVTPLGEIVAVPLRGAWTGNRGILHRGRTIVRSHASNLWITCELAFQGRWREQWQPGRYTYLYFHDEAVSFAAGHRPCAVCRRPAYLAFRAAWAAGLGEPVPSAAEMNKRLHAERLDGRSRRLHALPWRDVPSGAFVLVSHGPALVLDDQLVPWTVAGYGSAVARPAVGDATVITPPSSLAAFRAGYSPQLDPTAFRA